MANVSAIREPTVAELSAIAAKHGLAISDGEVEELYKAGKGMIAGFRRLGVLAEPTLPFAPREQGRAPLLSENPLGAWQWRTNIVASADDRKSSLLDGYTVAIKDNVCVGGVPMQNGSRVLEGFVPSQDATLVTRILEAGGRIIGKTVCEDLCLSGGSHTSAGGPVHNPYCYDRMAGGSSSGSAVVVATGEADMAIAGDQGGSIRIPSCWCGVVGLKPTHGLVPYTGVFSIEPTVDHVGPVAKDVRKASLLLEAIAGRDGLDARQAIAGAPDFRSPQFSGLSESLPTTKEEARQLLRKVTFGMVKEGFGIPEASEEDVDACVRHVVHTVIAFTGATVKDVSIPEHLEGAKLWSLTGVEGTYLTQFCTGGQGLGVKGHFMPDMMRFYNQGLATRASSLAWTSKLFLLLGDYIHTHYKGEFYARGQNLARALTKAYDKAFERCDILLMPTLPYKPPPLPNVDSCSITDYISASFKMIANTAPFDITGHPAVTVPASFVPCEHGEGITAKLPVGLMMVGRHMKDDELMRIARSFEILRGDLSPELAPECAGQGKH